MAHFYGIVSGQAKTRATRRGSKRSGLLTTAASYAGAVKTELSERNGIDWAHVTLEPWHGAGHHALIYDGPVNGEQETVNLWTGEIDRD